MNEDKSAKHALLALRDSRLGKNPKHVSHGHRRSVLRHVSDGTLDHETRWVLIDYRNGNEQIKKTVMNHLEAWKRNQTLEGTGLAWAKMNA